MLKLLGGIIALCLGFLIGAWVAYNVFVQRQAEFSGRPIGGFAMAAVFVGVGGKWVAEGWGTLPSFAPRKRTVKAKSKEKLRRAAFDPQDE